MEDVQLALDEDAPGPIASYDHVGATVDKPYGWPEWQRVVVWRAPERGEHIVSEATTRSLPAWEINKVLLWSRARHGGRW